MKKDKEFLEEVCACEAGGEECCGEECCGDGSGVCVNVNVDVHKIVRNLSIAGVLIVGIAVGCATYRKLKKWE